MRIGSVCSGIGAVEMSARRRGWEMAFTAEVEPFPAAVLMERFGATKPLRPLEHCFDDNGKTFKQKKAWKKKIAEMPEGGEVPNLGDFTLINEDDYDGTIDLLAGGTPCQDFSIAGLRKGLDGERGNLALEFAKLAYRSSARWLLWENVPGVFSSNEGQDFASFLSVVTGWEITVPADGWNNSGIVSGAPGCYGVAWRVLDVQYTRVPASFEYAIPQRRRRVFVIGYLGDWRPAAAVLFERECLQWHSPPHREAGSGVARSLTASTGGASAKEQQHTFIGDGNRPLNELDVYPTIDASEGKKWGSNQWIDNQHFIMSSGQGAKAGSIAACNDFSPTLGAADSGSNRTPSLMNVSTVRRLIPLECERLMGFPDNHTLIPWNGKQASECPDSPRYKACGNSMGNNVIDWLTIRIEMVQEILLTTKKHEEGII